MKDKTNKTVAISEDWKDRLNITEEELRQGEEEGTVEELEEGEEEDTRSLSDLKNDPDIANKWHNERTGETTEEELLQKAGGKWQEEESQADKIGKAVAKHLNQSEEEPETEELEKAKDRQEARQEEGSKELTQEWKNKLKEQGGSWIEEEELSQGEEEDGSILSEVKENTTVEELNSGKKRIDTTSIRAISEINSLNYEYPDMVNILHTDNEEGSMTAIVDPSIKQMLN